MDAPKIGRSLSNVSIDATRPRETPRPAVTFTTVLRGGASLLLAGAHAATSLVGTPMLSAAVARVRAGADGSGATATAPAAGEGDPLQGLADQGVSEDLKLLAMQREIQRQDRQISLVSNVMKARHDTAKAAIGNIRS